MQEITVLAILTSLRCPIELVFINSGLSTGDMEFHLLKRKSKFQSFNGDMMPFPDSSKWPIPITSQYSQSWELPSSFWSSSSTQIFQRSKEFSRQIELMH